MKNKVTPTGIVDADSTIIFKSALLIHRYARSTCKFNKMDAGIYRDKVKSIVRNARVLKQLQEDASKPRHLKVLNNINKGLLLVIENMNNLDGISLEAVKEQIDQDYGYFGYETLQQFKFPNTFAEEVLSPFQEKVEKASAELSQLNPVKEQAWKLDPIRSLARLQANLPSKFNEGSNTSRPDFHTYVQALYLVELKSTVSDDTVNKSINSA